MQILTGLCFVVVRVVRIFQGLHEVPDLQSVDAYVIFSCKLYKRI